MNAHILVDTDIAIDFLRGNRQALAYFKKESEAICFSVVTVAEIHAGVRNKKEEAEIERLFSVFPVADVTREIAREAGRLVGMYHSSHSVEIPDAIVAATCLVSGLRLHTLNTRHYPMFKDLLPPFRKQ